MNGEQIFYLATEFFIYALPPMDFGWGGLVHAETWIESMENSLSYGDEDYDDHKLYPQIKFLLTQALKLSGATNQQIRISPKVLVFPSGDPEPKIGFLLKLDDDGTTVCVSPYELPWLNKYFHDSFILPAIVTDKKYNTVRERASALGISLRVNEATAIGKIVSEKYRAKKGGKSQDKSDGTKGTAYEVAKTYCDDEWEWIDEEIKSACKAPQGLEAVLAIVENTADTLFDGHYTTRKFTTSYKGYYGFAIELEIFAQLKPFDSFLALLESMARTPQLHDSNKLEG